MLTSAELVAESFDSSFCVAPKYIDRAVAIPGHFSVARADDFADPVDTFGSVLMENELAVRNVQDTSHHTGALSCWLAGTSAKQAMVSGETDDDGIKGTKAPVRMPDFYATILYLPGMNHKGLTFRHSARYHPVADVEGQVVTAVLGGLQKANSA